MSAATCGTALPHIAALMAGYTCWRHRTLFFRDPEDNIIEIYAEY
jgi:catechol-2,3-dioxygenase